MASRTRRARAPGLWLTGPSPGAPTGWAVSAFSLAKGLVTQSEQWGRGGQAEVGVELRPGPRACWSLFQSVGKLGFLKSSGAGGLYRRSQGDQPFLGKAWEGQRPASGPPGCHLLCQHPESPFSNETVPLIDGSPPPTGECLRVRSRSFQQNAQNSHFCHFAYTGTSV